MTSRAATMLRLPVVVGLAIGVVGVHPARAGDITGPRLSKPSGGSQAASRRPSAGATLGPRADRPTGRGAEAPATARAPGAALATLGLGFEGFGFDDNATENGGNLFIPPDPIGATGTDRLIAVVNTMIEARNKGGTLLFRDALADFFAPLAPLTFTFDPKVVYDPYEDRFVVVTLERVDTGNNPDAGNMSRILLAVSRTGTPATATVADWWFQAIDAETSIGGFDYWVDYPGFEVDEEAVYVTANLFPHAPEDPVASVVRLWIVAKGAGSGGFYDGGTAGVTMHDPYAVDGVATTTMPCQVFGGGTPGIGTFLVSYSSLTLGGPGGAEFVQVVRVDDPLGTPAFAQEFVNVGDLEDVGGAFGFPDLPDAPQQGSAVPIEVNDSRALDCVWRNDRLWLTTTINPNAGPDAGQATAHWFELDTSATPGGTVTLDDQGDIGGEDIAPATSTFFPSVAVNSVGTAQFGFSGSAATIFPGAFVTGREAGDPPGTVQASATVHAGEDFYVRLFPAQGGTENRWGDYSGIALDPVNDDLFWVFNEYAAPRGTTIDGEDGRWGTAWAASTFAPPGSPVDVYFLVDLSGSFSDDLPVFQGDAPGIITSILTANANTKFGLGSFEDYPISPFGNPLTGDVAYRRDIDLTTNSTAVETVIANLFTRDGVDLPQSQLPALFQAATGAGQDLSASGFPGASIPANQQANFRSGATKLFLLWTDAAFHLPGDPGAIPYPGPSFTDTVDAVLALDPPKVIGVASGSDPGAIADLRAIAAATGALAPPGGVDCDGDGTIDIPEGEPLVCTTPPTGAGIGSAIIAIVDAATTIPVGVAVKPMADPAPINPRSRGVTPVAILGSASFSVVSVNPATLRFGPAGAAPAHDLSDPAAYLDHIRDVDGDGFPDLVAHYRTDETGLVCGDLSAPLSGQTFNEQPIEGSGAIVTVGCRPKS